MTSFKLIKIGILYDSQLKIRQTSSAKIILSHLQSLAKTRYVQKHNHVISYSLKYMERNFKYTVSARMIKRQIKILAEENHVHILAGEENKYIVNPVADIKFVPIFLLLKICDSERLKYIIEKSETNNITEFITDYDENGNKKDEVNTEEDTKNKYEALSPSTNIILSVLLDKVAFNYRATGTTQIYPYQIKSIADDLKICKRTFKNTLRELISLKIIKAPLDADFDNFSAIILKTGFTFTDEFFAAYKKIVKIEPSKKCQQIFRKYAHMISKNKIIRINKSVNKHVYNNKKTAAYIAEKPRTTAEDPYKRQYAQSAPGNTIYSSSYLRAAVANMSCERQRISEAENTQFPTDINGVENFGNEKNSTGNFWSNPSDFPLQKWKKMVPYM